MADEKLFTNYLGKDGEYDLLKIEYLQYSADDQFKQYPIFRGLILRIRPENLPVVNLEGDTPHKTLSFFHMKSNEEPTVLSGIVEALGEISATILPNDRLKGLVSDAQNKNLPMTLSNVRVLSCTRTRVGTPEPDTFEVRIGKAEVVTAPTTKVVGFLEPSPLPPPCGEA